MRPRVELVATVAIDGEAIASLSGRLDPEHGEVMRRRLRQALGSHAARGAAKAFETSSLADAVAFDLLASAPAAFAAAGWQLCLAEPTPRIAQLAKLAGEHGAAAAEATTSGPGDAGVRAASEADPAVPVAPDLVAAIVGRLFSAGLHLAAAERLADDVVGTRIAAALRELDAAIGDLRRVVVSRGPSDSQA